MYFLSHSGHKPRLGGLEEWLFFSPVHPSAVLNRIISLGFFLGLKLELWFCSLTLIECNSWTNLKGRIHGRMPSTDCFISLPTNLEFGGPFK